MSPSAIVQVLGTLLLVTGASMSLPLAWSIYAGGDDREIIGVMGPDFWFPRDDVVLWIPMQIDASRITPGRFGNPLPTEPLRWT